MNLQKHIFFENKGILAIDESESTSKARFEAKNLVSTPEFRQAWRSSLINTPKIEDFLSGLIVVEETINQKDQNGKKLVEILKEKNIKIFVKVDEGLDNSTTQPLTKGIENLEEKLKNLIKKYEGEVAGTKWRTVILTSQNQEKLCQETEKSLKTLAEYAKIVLKSGLTPIVEPEIIVDEEIGEEKTVKLHQLVTQTLIKNLENAGLELDKIILKMGFVYTLNQKNKYKSEISRDIGQQTLKVLNEKGMNKFMGIVFLSGGLNPVQSAEIMQMTRKYNQQGLKITFSFGRAIQDEGFDEWVKTLDYDNKNVQNALLNRLKEINKKLD